MNDDWNEAFRAIQGGEDVQQACENVSRKRLERVREGLRSEGRVDLVADLDANLKRLRLGITQAENIWHSISVAQRRVLLLLSLGNRRILVPHPASRTRYDLVGGEIDALSNVCSSATVRALHARSLIEATGANVFRYALTERGLFVLKHRLAFE